MSGLAGRWSSEEAWSGLRAKTDIRVADLFVEEIATARMTPNLRHYRLWELLPARLAEDLMGIDVCELERIGGILERARRGQRLARGLSATGETEEAVRAQGEAKMRRVIDAAKKNGEAHVAQMADVGIEASGQFPAQPRSQS